MIAARMPGLGDPRELRIDEFNKLIERLGVVGKLQNPMGISPRELLEIEAGLY